MTRFCPAGSDRLPRLIRRAPRHWRRIKSATVFAAAVRAAAVAAAEETAVAAARVATAVAAAAAEVACRVSDSDVAIAAEVTEVAAAVQATATATARHVAAETDARANSVAMVAREAVAASFLDVYDDDPLPADPATTAKGLAASVIPQMRS